MFRGLLLTKADSDFKAEVADIDESQLPEGDVTLRVDYSTINFKDALAITNTSPVVRKWPMIAGIDGAGTVEASQHPNWTVGDKVILTGWGVGETHWGCLAQKARLNGDWLVPVPDAFTTRQAMALGTAGLTAALCVLTLERHGVTPDQGEILVTGASGGVGSTAIAVLSKSGYTVVASTGKLNEVDYLKSLGASSIVDRAELSQPGRPLQSERWAGVVDSVGSHTLANACAQCKYHAVVAACGLAQGMDFPGTVAPFILRGVTLAGVESVYANQASRQEAWNRLAIDVDPTKLEMISTTIGLAEAIERAPGVIAGKVRGRLVVDVNQ